MEDLVKYLAGFNPAIKGSQYAVGGNWEEAIKVDLDNPAISEIPKELDPSVAIEVFYEVDDARMLFLGLRYTEGLVKAHSPNQFMQNVLEVISHARQQSLEGLFRQLGHSLNDNELTYLSGHIGYVELGVVDFWKSAGSLVLRKASDPKLDGESLESLLQKNSSLQENTMNHVALEFALEKPEVWIGVQVSEKVGNDFKTDTNTLLTLANLL